MKSKEFDQELRRVNEKFKQQLQKQIEETQKYKHFVRERDQTIERLQTMQSH